MKGKGGAITLPDFEMNDVSDYYTMYVSIMGVSENVFWNSNVAFVKKVAENKQAYDKWMNRQVELRNGKKRSKN